MCFVQAAQETEPVVFLSLHSRKNSFDYQRCSLFVETASSVCWTPLVGPSRVLPAQNLK